MTDILELIGKGKENAVTNAELQEIMHVSRREVSQAIHELRASGQIIVSDNHGYYTPNTEAELICGYDTLWKKSVSLLAVLKNTRREIKRKNLFPLTAEARAKEARKKRETDKTDVSDEL